jgi:tRNA(fMet)-specific endonuclease VapC
MGMKYLLDTNTWAAYLNRRTTNVPKRVAATAPDEIRLCSIVKAELYYGAHKGSRTAANLALIANLSGRFLSLDFDDQAAEICGRIRAHLAVQGTNWSQ